MELQQRIDTLQEQIINNQRELAILHNLKDKFPDIKINVDRWKNQRKFTEKVNSIVDQVEITHNCGCCSDSPLEAYPYVVIDDSKVYSNPPCFTIGEKGWAGGDIPNSGWEKKLQKENIPDGVLRQIQQYFMDNLPYNEDAMTSALANIKSDIFFNQQGDK